MAHSTTLKNFCLASTLLYFACSCCKAQDAVRIVAKAALCFDNRTVINDCLTSMGISVNEVTANATVLHSATVSAQNNSAAAVFCDSPCYEQMMQIADCVDGIMSNFQSYKPGIMEGVRSVFETSCSGIEGSSSTSTTKHSTRNEGVSVESGKLKGDSKSGNELVVQKPISSLWMPFILASVLLS